METSEMELCSNHKYWGGERMFTSTIIYNFFGRHLKSNSIKELNFDFQI